MRSFSPSQVNRRPHAPSATASVQASTSCIPYGSRIGTELANSRCS